jgi:NAD(P)-dependent dehydrogenase (short-subunit alcohol dehydrogenase family)
MSTVTGKVCVVTGAGSGIGRALAHELARRGARAIAISDVNEAGLADTAAALERGAAEVHAAPLNVANRAAFAAYAGEVAGRFGAVHQLFNNAGIAGSAPLLDGDYVAFERVLDVNLWGVIHGTMEFLPHLIASGDGHVINVSSLNGYLAQATMAPYCASKFAVRGFTESLRAEMMRDRRPVRVTVVHPGGVRTDIANAALRDAHRPTTPEEEARLRFYNEKLLRMDPARAARIIIDGVERNRPRVRVGNDAKAMDIIVRLLPSRYLQLTALFERAIAR